jgi:hypothetical protein
MMHSRYVAERRRTGGGDRVSGKDLTGYINGWIYSATTPPMPGHPDWKPKS